MIIGSYPCCDALLFLGLPDDVELPKFYKETCEGCGATVWHKLSRVDPKSWTEEDFLKEFSVDESTKNITSKEENR